MFLICFLIHESDFKECKTCEGVMTSNARSSRVIHRSAGVHPACTEYTYIKLALKHSLYWWIYWSTDHRCYYGAMFYHTSAASFHSNRMLILLLRATCTGHHSFIHLWRSSLAHLYSEYHLLLAHLAYPSKAMVVPPCICSYDTIFEMCHS